MTPRGSIPPGPDADEVIALTRDLVRIPSPRGDEHAIAGTIARWLEDLGWRVDISDGRNVAGANADEVDLAFLAYVDTPPAGAMTDPYGAASVETQIGHAIRGRGALTKGPLAAALAACRIAARRHPGLGLALLATTDDNEGLRAALSRTPIRIRHAIGAEPTDGSLGVRARGILWLDVIIEGQAAHAGSASEAANPVDVLAELVPALRRLAHPAERGLARAPFTPMSVETEGAAPRTPSRVRLRLDRRTFVDETRDDLRTAVESELAAACASHPGIHGRVEIAGSMNAFAADASSELLPAVVAASRAVTGRAPDEIPLPFATNVGYAAARGIDCVAFGPGRITDLGDDEAIGIDGLVEAGIIYAAVAERFA